jgi:hypothetical protein
MAVVVEIPAAAEEDSAVIRQIQTALEPLGSVILHKVPAPFLSLYLALEGEAAGADQAVPALAFYLTDAPSRRHLSIAQSQ